MRVPVAVAERVDGDQRHARLDQSPGQQAVLGEGGGAVASRTFSGSLARSKASRLAGEESSS